MPICTCFTNMETTTIIFPFSFQVVAAAITALLFAALFLRRKNQTIKREQPSKWPLIGHLHLFLGGGPLPLHAKLAELADRFGPIMRLRLGSKPTIIVSDAITARECFTTNDLALASRPLSATGKFFAFDFTAFAFAPYGEAWRELRKICTHDLLMARRLEAAAFIRDEETRHCVRELLEKGEQAKVEVREHLVDLVLRTIMRMAAGRSSSCFGNDEEAKELKHLIEEASFLSGVPDLGDSLPFLKWLDLQGTQKEMKRVADRLESMAQSWIDTRVKLMEEEEKEEGSKAINNADFIDALLSIERENKYLASLSPARRKLTIRANLMLMVQASTDTSSVTMEWALASLLAQPEAMRRSQEELDATVGKERLVEESDIQNLPYLQAVVKETLRLHPAGPLLVPHESMEECVVAGSRVPVGTRLLINAWKIHRDPTLWRNPLEFEPDRFLGESSHIDVKGRHFELIPFGSGRRLCPGMSLALSMLHLSLARLLQSFDFLVPQGADASKVDMREGMGITCPKLVPLEVNLVPRLPSHLY